MESCEKNPSRCLDAVILAGGKSIRMGTDKAMLQLEGETLLERQVRRVRAAGAATVYISCRREADYRIAGTVPLFDRVPDGGPLEGIAAALDHSQQDSLLVLAVDLPSITPEFLAWLLSNAETGVVPIRDGKMEPLAAIYLAGAAELARQQIAAGRRSARDFAAAACEAGWSVALPVPPPLAACLTNWNHPDDWKPCKLT